MDAYKTVSSLLLLLCGLLCYELTTVKAEGFAACCMINTTSACQEKCGEFAGHTTLRHLNSSEQQNLMIPCPRSHSSFWSCMNSSFTNSSTEVVATGVPTGYLACCDQAPTESCKSKCQDMFGSAQVDGNLDVLQEFCGTVQLRLEFWTCLISITPTTASVATLLPPEKQNADWARLQCCFKAKKKKCRSDCIDVQMNKGTASQFNYLSLTCLHQPEERSLSTCMSDVTPGPCKLGCSGMQFCNNFNNRPYQAFRRCDVEVDREAKKTYLQWKRSKFIPHPLFGIRVTSIENCLSDMWKAVACISSLEPCETNTHSSQLCRKDCLKLLESCSNSTRSPARVCDIIAPESVQSDCIPLDQFLQPSSFGDDVIAPASTMIDNPCDPNPCTSGFYCVINRLCDATTVGLCTAYECHPGCVVGSSPGITFIKGSTVRVSLLSNATSRCFGYFNCTTPTDVDTSINTRVYNQRIHPPVKNFIPTNGSCERERSCTLSNGDTYGHQSHFWRNCNFCYCSYGRIICTKRTCLNHNSPVAWDCNCTDAYEPVCTSDGITIRNKCTAMCLGYSMIDFHSGYCGSLYQCSRFHSNNCKRGSICIPLRHTCLAANFSRKFCQQYTCETQRDACSRTVSQTPVCDILNKQHSSLCSLLGTQDYFSYWGYCKDECSKDESSAVCGANGETFPSKCHAQTMHISVDYIGECMAAPPTVVDEDIFTSHCENVTCPAVEFPGCRTVIPYGACCPICGSSMIILNDDKVLGDNLAYLKRDYISSSEVIERLQHHVNYIQCHVYGHVLEDGSLILILAPGKRYDNRYILSEVCYQEMVKLCTLINNQSPVITDDIFLSHLVAAYVENGTKVSRPSTAKLQATTQTNNCINFTPSWLTQISSVIFMIFIIQH